MVGFILLCHTHLDRAAQVARHWAEGGAPVVIHLDARVAEAEASAFRGALADLPKVRFAPRHRGEWGTFGLVSATLAAAEVMLRDEPGVGHVFLASGSCLPLRPLAELRAYLAERQDTDFIESVAVGDTPWIVGGLAMERFTLRFPFAWRRQRALFDGYVRLQRRLGMRRHWPEGIVPHLGSQWWCLTRATLGAILNEPRRAAFDRYFSRVWIPDESYFQSLARRHSTRIDSRTLTLSKFDLHGRPHSFYDDHLQLLRRSDCFVARKIWPRAERLYQTFLGPPAALPRSEPQPAKIDRLFAKAAERQAYGRPGLVMQSRFPARDGDIGRTAAPYSLLHGFDDLFEGFDAWLTKAAGARVHGHLFAPDRADFAGSEPVFNGALPSSAAFRDYNPRAFLTNLLWATRGDRQIFQFGPDDQDRILPFIAGDAQAQVSVISGAWAVRLFHLGAEFADVRAEAARLQRAEAAQLAIWRGPDVKARVRIWTVAGFLEHPVENLQGILDDIVPRAPRRLTEAPRLRSLAGFGQFLQDLKNQGMQPVLTGDFPVDRDGGGSERPRARPYLVR